ncbi:hypothetical protein SS50377_21798 [Spironucleus salmonicida]|uniref:Uncharacterized protein n=1 Tax=Spironucleus salmonicida TaxID=348837 RepID=A0A9P8LYE4_9EUKA|nr:hypothetical protein SS50377_21798 [Spironucleus salmonicida]
MRISESFDPDNHCQSLIDTDIMIKAYCVFEELVYAEARIQKQLPINFDSQIDKSKIYGINISVSALIYQQLRLISQQLYSIFKLDLLAFDCVISKNNKLFIVDLNYFTHDSIDCSLWALQWYARSKEQKIL